MKSSMPKNAFPKKAYRIRLSENIWVADNEGTFIQVDNEKFALIFFDREIAESELDGFKDLYYPDYEESIVEVVE